MNSKKSKIENVAQNATGGDRDPGPLKRQKKRKKKRPTWVATPAAVAAAIKQFLEAGIAKGTDNLKLAQQLRGRIQNSKKWKAVLDSLLTDAIAIARHRLLRKGVPKEEAWLIPECEHVPQKLRLDNRAVPLREATLDQLIRYTDRFAKRSTRSETKLAELRLLVERVSAIAKGDLTVTVGSAIAQPLALEAGG